jgi:glycerophosphoryl diester phosphodiesterase
MTRPLVIAHRGACWELPENTLAAFELAIQEEADYVEFDVRTSSDGTLVVCHDPPPEPRPPEIPTLDEVLAALGGRVPLAIEIKEGVVAEHALRAVRAHRIDAEELIILSFRIRALERVRRLRPELRTVLHLGRRPDPVAATRFWGVGFEDAAARPKQIRLAQSFGLATSVYTINDERRMLELARLGVTAIFTDRPGLLRETLAARQG